MKTPVGIPLLLLALTCPQIAGAEVISSARELAKEAIEAYDQGRYEESAEKSQRAYQLVRVPTLALHLARTYAKLGRLVRASELYLEASRLKPDGSWQDAQLEAQRVAASERATLLPTIPRLMIHIDGAEPTQVAVTLDGATVPAALIDVEQMVDPGDRVVVGKRGDELVREPVRLEESDHVKVVLTFKAISNPLATASADEKGTAREPNVARPTHAAKQRDFEKILGWTSLGLSATAIAVGVWQNYSAKSKRTSLIDSKNCSADGLHCDASLAGDVDAYMTARTLRTVGYVAGGVFAAAGITLLVWPTAKQESPPVALGIGPGFLNISGEM